MSATPLTTGTTSISPAIRRVTSPSRRTKRSSRPMASIAGDSAARRPLSSNETHPLTQIRSSLDRPLISGMYVAPAWALVVWIAHFNREPHDNLFSGVEGAAGGDHSLEFLAVEIAQAHTAEILSYHSQPGRLRSQVLARDVGLQAQPVD